MPTNNAKTKNTHNLCSNSSTTGWTSDGFTRLKAYLGNVFRGQSKIYTTPFAKGESTKDLLNAWGQELVSLGEEWPTLLDFEDDMRTKVGPLSVQLPLKERMEDIYHYYDDIHLSSKPIADSAIRAVIQEFSPVRGLTLRSQENTVEMMKKSTNSGAPFFTKRRNVVQDTIPVQNTRTGLHRFGEYLGFERKYKPDITAVLGWRGQEGGPKEDDVKQRVVWMFPFGVNVAELQCYQPFIERVQRYNLVPAWVSMESVDNHITKLFDTKDSDDLVICTDFSKFDQHFNKDMQTCTERILHAIMRPGKTTINWMMNIFPIKYNIPLTISAFDDEFNMIVGEHGMGSGSGGTNADETLAHRALQYEAAQINGAKLNPYSMCLGDDGVLSFPGITVDKVVNAYERHGQECNKTKQYASTQDCVYLRRWHSKYYRINGVCVGVYSTMRALGRMRYLERFMDPDVWTPEMVNLRYLSILENCKYHPMREKFAQFCMKRDKYRLGIDIPGFFDNITQLSKEAIDYMPDFMGYTKTLQGFRPDGINTWWIVNYLKSLS